MDQILEAYESVKNNAIRGDCIDKIHSKYSIVVVFVSIAIVLIRLGDGYGINCWLPAQLSDSQNDYSHKICWVNNTYYYPDVTDADLFSQNQKFNIQYYQFILFILFGQALLFMLPDFIWKILSSSSGGYVKKLLDQLSKSNVLKESIKNSPKSTGLLRSMSSETEIEPLLINDDIKESFKSNFNSIVFQENERKKFSEKNISMFPKELNDSDSYPSRNLKEKIKKIFKTTINSKKKITSFMKPSEGLKDLTKHYMILKFLNLFNIIFQLIVLQFIFGNNFYSYGVDFFISLSEKKNPFNLTTQFPIRTICDFFVHNNLNKIHWYSVECLLSINILIEKIYVVFWFWYVFLLILTVLNIIVWFQEITYSQKISFLYKYLNIRKNMIRPTDEMSSNPKRRVIFDLQKDQVKDFYRSYLNTDGVLMLHLVKNVAGSLIFVDLLYELWIEYLNKKNVIKYEKDKIEQDQNENEK